MTILRIGTRASELARLQAELVAHMLRKADFKTELVLVSTKGDKDRDARFRELGTGIFTRALDEALLGEEIDLAVHSAKDVPTTIPDEIGICAFTERAPCEDVIVFFQGDGDFRKLPPNSVIGTSSARRKALLLNLSSGAVRVKELRGNVQTRLGKAREQGFRGAVLARAACRRLNLSFSEKVQVLDPNVFIPAPGQGALAVAALKDSPFFGTLYDVLDHEETRLCVSAERSFSRKLGGGCQVPMGAFAELKNETLVLSVVLLSESGNVGLRTTKRGRGDDAEFLGEKAAEEILETGGRGILETLKRGEKE